MKRDVPEDVSPATLGGLRGRGGGDMSHLRVPSAWRKMRPQQSPVIMWVDERGDRWVGVWEGGWVGERNEDWVGGSLMGG